jgi:hypothetical protein
MMGIIDKLIGGQVAQPIEAIGNVFDKIFTSDEEKLQAEAVLARIKQHPALVQTEINKLEAQHRSLFVAGWRPSIGWVCSMGLFLYYIPQYALASIIWLKLSWAASELVAYPATPDALMELVIAMLGMGALRGMDKITGKSK